jgi:hypothetical protein
MEIAHCNVKFYWLVPHNLEAVPYVVFATQGVHLHPPPPPTSTPARIETRLRDIIAKENTLTLTCGMLLQLLYNVNTLIL